MVIFFSKNQSNRWSQKMNKKCKSNFYWIRFILRFQDIKDPSKSWCE